MCYTSIYLVCAVIFLPTTISDCVKSSSTVITCEDVSVISENYLKEVSKDLDKIKKVIVENRDNDLQVSSTSFKSTTNLETVLINRSKMWKVWSDTYVNMPLVRIDLSRNAISLIEKNAFSNLEKLQRIDMKHNQLKEIGKNMFSHLPLTVLSLSHNLIRSIENMALENLPNLKILHLDNNLLNFVYAYEFLSYPQKLEILWLHRNSLRLVTRNMLRGLTNLRVLNLDHNQLESVETSAFEQTKNLKTLVLSHNRLKQMEADVFSSRGLMFLENLYLDNNRLMFLSRNFFFQLKRLQRVTLVGNPWICDCFDEVRRYLMENSVSEKCNEHFLDGSRPVCVGDYSCNYKYNEKLSETYDKVLSTNPIYIKQIDCILGSAL